MFHGKKAQTMNSTEHIDKQIAELTDWRGPIFVQLRKLIHETNADLIEEWKWNTAVWSHQGLVCAVGSFQESSENELFFKALF